MLPEEPSEIVPSATVVGAQDTGGNGHGTRETAKSRENQRTGGSAEFVQASGTGDRTAERHVAGGSEIEGIGGTKTDGTIEVGGETIAVGHRAAIEDEAIGEVVVAIERECATRSECNRAGS